MKLHKPITEVITENIRLIFEDDNHIKYVIRKSLVENKKFGSRDRRFVADHTIELVRMFKYYSFLAGTEKDFRKITQVYFFTLTDHAPVWITSYIDAEDIKKRQQEADKKREVKHSFPVWLDLLMAEELGEEKWNHEVNFLNEKALPALRVNKLKTTLDDLKKDFIKNEIPFTELSGIDGALELKKRRDLSALNSFKDGWFEMQDQGSQLISPYLAPTPGSMVVDACAGAGGKTLHLAELMENKGQIIALDVVPKKLKELDKRLERAGAENIKTQIAKDSTVESLANWADFLLLDVPCSGVGVLRRNPDDKWKLNAERFKELTEIQASILNNYSSMLKPGGVMVYATCSVLPSENEKQVSSFLKENKDFSLLKEQTIYPSEGGDGFYMARIERMA